MESAPRPLGLMSAHRWIPRRLSKSLGLLALLLVSPAATSRPLVSGTPGTAVRGVVRDASGSPVAGARLLRLDLRVSRLCPDPHTGSLENLYLAVTPGEARVAGPSTAPAAGGEAGSGTAWSTITDNNGHFELPKGEEERGQGLTLVTADGYAPALEFLKAASPPRVILEKGNRLIVHLLTDQAKPVENAEATLIPLSACRAAIQALEDVFVLSARGDPDGTVEFRHVPDGVYALRLVAKGRVSSNVAPLLVGEEHSEFRVRLPQARSFSTGVELPPRTPRSPGAVLAFWKNPDGWPQWAEGRFSAAEPAIEMDGLPFMESVTLFARTESGLSSRWVARDKVGNSGSGSIRSILLRARASWEGILEEGVQASSLIVEPVFPAFSLPLSSLAALSVPVGSDRRFVVPDVSPAAERLRIIVPGLGETEVRLEEGAAMDLGTVRIPPRHIVEGSVALDGAGPLGGAEVQVRTFGRILCRARTTAEGKFACATNAAGARGVHFRASAEGIDLRLTSPAGDGSGLLVPSPAGSIRLKVTRPGGTRGVKDLRIEIDPGSGGGAGIGVTRQKTLYTHSPAGVFSLHSVEEGPVRLNVSSPGGIPHSTSAITPTPAGPPVEAALVLPEGPAVFGTVLAQATRAPVPGAEVELGTGTVSVEQAEVARIVRAGAEGAWRFDEVPEGTYQLTASAPTYSPAGKVLSVPADTNRISQELLLQRPGRVRGRVLNLPEGSKATVSLYSRTWWIGWNNYKGDADPKGQFAFENVRPDRYDVTLWVRTAARLSLSRSIEATVRPGETTEVELDLRSGIVVSGKVYLGEKVNPGATVLFLKQSRKTLFSTLDSGRVDEAGRYSVSLPSAGRYRVRMHPAPPNNRGPGVFLGEFQEIGPESPQSLDLRFSDARIRGRVLDQKGRPFPGAYLVVTQSRSPADLSEDREWDYQDYGSTGDGGTFEFGPVPPGEYNLGVSAEGCSRMDLGPVALANNQILDLPDIILESETPFRVKVVDAQGVPQAGVFVTASPPSNLQASSGDGKTEENGEAALKGLSPGTYTLVALLRGWPPALSGEVKVPLEESAPLPVLQFAPGGSLEIRVVDRSGSPVSGTSPRMIDGEGRDVTVFYRVLADMVKSPWSTDEQGRAHLTAVAPGEYSVKAGSGKDSDARSVTVAVGQTARVTLVIADTEDP